MRHKVSKPHHVRLPQYNIKEPTPYYYSTVLRSTCNLKYQQSALLHKATLHTLQPYLVCGPRAFPDIGCKYPSFSFLFWKGRGCPCRRPLQARQGEELFLPL
ncbi:hypothetical protein HZ326_26456 [Fusarium oxysporum f. sp. albedinis]|nr:hypothetical protein HZ326_26456 [Fusarium oxysporum f. sp. albedinis]